MVKTIFYFFCGHYGDALINSPAIEGLREKYPHAKIFSNNVKCFVDIYENNPRLDGFVSSPEEVFVDKEFMQRRAANDFSRDEVLVLTCYLKTKPTLHRVVLPAVDFVCRIVKVTPESNRIRIYLSSEDETFAKGFYKKNRQKTVIFHNRKFLYAPQKEWYNEKWAEVIDYINRCGHQVIQVGIHDDPYIEGAIDLRDQTTIREAFALLKYADCFLGLDPVFNHASNAFLKPSVVLFGSTTPEVWGYDHNINIYKGLKCQPCWDLLGNKCHVRKCMAQITVDDVIEAITRIIRVNS